MIRTLGGGCRRTRSGFNGNNPVTFTDPFGLCPENNTVCPLIEFTTTVLGGVGGFIAGGGTGGAITLATGGAGIAAIPALALQGAAGGATGGLLLGKAITGVMFSKASSNTASGGADEPERTAGEIISAEKKGSINRVFPEQMRGKTIGEIEKLAKQGDKAARTARKLLTDGRFDK
jgi:hypothetical protein